MVLKEHKQHHIPHTAACDEQLDMKCLLPSTCHTAILPQACILHTGANDTLAQQQTIKLVVKFTNGATPWGPDGR